MKIGILMTGHPPDAISDAGRYDAYFARLLDGHGFEFQGWAVVDNEFPKSVHDTDGWLITGSRHGAYEPHGWIAPLEQFIRDVHAEKTPMIGVCFGHQIIAQALGGKVEKFAGGWSVGRTDYDVEGRIMAINAWHQDQVTVRPENARVIARTEFCENAGLVYGDTIWTIQPHPEYDNAFIEALIRYRGRGVIPDDLLKEAISKLDRPNDRAEMAEMMAAFFKRERA